MTDIILIMLKLLFWFGVVALCLYGVVLIVSEDTPKETRIALFIGVLSLSNIAYWELDNIGRTIDCEYHKIC